jgi:hypothetical protein
MAAQNLKLAGKEFVLLPKREYATLQRKAQSNRNGKHKKKNNRGSGLPPVEIYTDERIAEFLLANSVGADDYAEACDEVRKMGLDPARIRHVKPAGIA